MARELCEDKKSKNMVSSSCGFFYTDVSLSNHDPTMNETKFTNQFNGYESNPEIFNMTTGMEMVGFSKHQTTAYPSSGEAMWKELLGKASTENQSAGPSSSRDFYQQDHNKADFTTGISETSSENLFVGPGPNNWQENRFLVHDDSSLRCVFPCEGNERPSQGLSLSLSSNNPSSIGLLPFELRQTSSHHQQQFVSNTSYRDGLFGKSVNIQENQIMTDEFLEKAANIYNNEGQFQLRNSKYLGPAREILKEFCCLGTKKQTDLANKSKTQKSKQFEEDINGSNSSRNKQPLEIMELQETKTKLISMLEEVERRYKDYCDQMRGVVVSFEAIAGSEAAEVYSALASKAMSRHFKCLKDGILRQIQEMREKDPGTSRGETPRLRAIDEAIRQKRAFQQMSMLETHPWRPQRGLPEPSVSVLRAWLFEHFLHPYPSDVDKHILALQTGLSRSQVSNWFINARVRLWKPMVEEMYLEETKEQEGTSTTNNMASPPDGVNMELNNNNGWPSRNTNLNPPEEEKPTPNQLVRIDSECLSSMITNPNKNYYSRSSKTLQNHHMMNHQQHFGTIDRDFSSYNNQIHSEAGSVSYANHDHHHNSNNNNHINFIRRGVSLTLGLQQNNNNNNNNNNNDDDDGSGVSLAFSQSSLFHPRDHIDECQPVQYSLLDGDQNQNLPYRNLMGAQLFHDLAG